MTSSLVFKIISYFPGVPIFFFVSGFLVPRSFEKLQGGLAGTYEFLKNRTLRLYPALWACFLVSVLSVYYSGYFDQIKFEFQSFSLWAIAQNSFAQFYNPEFLRGYGTGVLNGSLWTITVELQFYLLTPIMVFLFRKNVSAIVAVTLVFASFNLILNNAGVPDSTGAKLIWVSFVPWIYMFLLGYLVATSKRLFKGIHRLPLLAVLVAYCVVFYATENFIDGNNHIHPAATVLLSCLIIKVAYQKSNLSQKLLGKNDISYGVYIYHMPIVNLFLFVNFAWSTAVQIAVIYLAVILVAGASWFAIEKPALRLKKRSMRTLEQ